VHKWNFISTGTSWELNCRTSYTFVSNIVTKKGQDETNAAALQPDSEQIHTKCLNTFQKFFLSWAPCAEGVICFNAYCSRSVPEIVEPRSYRVCTNIDFPMPHDPVSVPQCHTQPNNYTEMRFTAFQDMTPCRLAIFSID
jgi:hypothetical protein